jgi:hypothetical protein
MALVVVGGHSRNVGKTSVVAGLIGALAEYQWSAFKITQYGHGVCSRNGEACDCATGDHSWAITEEKNLSGESDTSRFLVAGAKPVWWVRTEQGRLAEAMPMVRRRLAEVEHAIIESNSIVKFVRPDLYLTVLDPATQDFKLSAREFLDRADAVILHENHSDESKEKDPRRDPWRDVSLKPVASKRLFRVQPPEYVTAEIVDFIRQHLRSISSL